MNDRELLEKWERKESEFRLSGWDFSQIDGRWDCPEPPWDWRLAVKSYLREADALLDGVLYFHGAPEGVSYKGCLIGTTVMDSSRPICSKLTRVCGKGGFLPLHCAADNGEQGQVPVPAAVRSIVRQNRLR